MPFSDRERLVAWAVTPLWSRSRRDRASQLRSLLVDGTVYSGLPGAGGIRGPMLTMMFGPWDWENGTGHRE